MKATGMLGADPDELDTLAGTFERTAVQLRQQQRKVSAAVESSGWDGPDAAGFRSAWSSNAAPIFSRVVSLLEENAKTLARNAQDQRRTSGELGGSSTPRGGAGGGTKVTPGGGVGSSEWWDGIGRDDIRWFGDMGLTIIDLIELAEGANGAPWASILFSGASFIDSWQRYGLWDAKTLQDLFTGGGGLIAGAVAGPIGALAWTGSTTVGEFLGRHILEFDDWVVENATGSKEGFANSMWMMRNYGVWTSEHLPPHIRNEAVTRLVEHRSGATGMWNTFVIDPMENGWYVADQVAGTVKGLVGW